jgi:ADP-glucose pyrophosphorylase
VITYNLKTEKVIYEKLENGDFEITISISAKRFETMEAGDFSPIQINEPIQIGAFTENPRNVENDEMVLYLESHQIDKEKMNLKIITKALPKYIAIDPFGTRLDENRKDNISEITDL